MHALALFALPSFRAWQFSAASFPCTVAFPCAISWACAVLLPVNVADRNSDGLSLQVLYLTEAIDEVVFTNLATFDGKQLVDVSREGLELDADEEQKVRNLMWTTPADVCRLSVILVH